MEVKGKERIRVADQIFQNFIDFFGVESVRDKRNDEGKFRTRKDEETAYRMDVVKIWEKCVLNR